MATNFQYTQPKIVEILTTRVLTIATDPTTQVLLTQSDTRLVFVTALGPGAVTWGDSSVQALSGGILFYSMGKQWDTPHQGWSQYFIADSVSSFIAVQELG